MKKKRQLRKAVIHITEYFGVVFTVFDHDLYISLDAQGFYIHAGDFYLDLPWFDEGGN